MEYRKSISLTRAYTFSVGQRGCCWGDPATRRDKTEDHGRSGKVRERKFHGGRRSEKLPGVSGCWKQEQTSDFSKI